MKITLDIDDDTRFLSVTLCKAGKGSYEIGCAIRAYVEEELYDGAIIEIKDEIKERREHGNKMEHR